MRTKANLFTLMVCFELDKDKELIAQKREVKKAPEKDVIGENGGVSVIAPHT